MIARRLLTGDCDTPLTCSDSYSTGIVGATRGFYAMTFHIHLLFTFGPSEGQIRRTDQNDRREPCTGMEEPGGGAREPRVMHS